MLAAMCVGMFLVLLDVTVVNVALPSLRAGLGIGLAAQQWIVDSYAIVLASLLLVGGSVGGRFGHKRAMVVGMAVFGAASLACGAAPGLGILIAGRVAQGVGAALLLPASLAILAHAYPGRSEQARAIGIWSGVSALALPAGPLIAGALVTGVGWRSVFLVNTPVVILVGAAIVWLVPETRDAGAGSVDAVGGALAAIGLAGVVAAVILAGRGVATGGAGTEVAGVEASGPEVAAACGAAAAGVLSLGGFALRERFAARPMFPPSLMRVPGFAGANLVAAAMNAVGIGTVFVLTLYLQTVQHRSALQAGAMLLPLFIPLVVLAPLTGRLVARIGPRLPMCAGLALGIAGCLGLVGLSPASGYLRLLPVLLGLGLGMGLLTPAVVAAAMRAVPEGRSGLTSGVNNMARQAGGAIGVAGYGAIAGSPLIAHGFVRGLGQLGLIGAAIWIAALVLAWITVPAAARHCPGPIIRNNPGPAAGDPRSSAAAGRGGGRPS